MKAANPQIIDSSLSSTAFDCHEAKVSRMDKQLVRRRNLRTALLTDAQAVAKKAALEYEAIQAVAKQAALEYIAIQGECCTDFPSTVNHVQVRYAHSLELTGYFQDAGNSDAWYLPCLAQPKSAHLTGPCEENLPVWTKTCEMRLSLCIET
eukprot:scaffold3068_cov17-Tisochrysis_lutea.AAC.1